MTILRKPHGSAQLLAENRASLVIEQMTITPLFPAGFTFTGTSGAAEVIAHGQYVMGNEEQTKITVPTYMVRTGDGREVACRTRHILSNLSGCEIEHLPEREHIALVEFDKCQFLIDPFGKGTQIDDPTFHVLYTDSYGWPIHDVVLRAVARLVHFIDDIPPLGSPFIRIANSTNCANCGAIRRLSTTDAVMGDVAANMYSTGTWDKSGPNKNNIHCSWLGNPNPEWELICQTKNRAFSRDEKRPEAWLNDINHNCAKFYNDDSPVNFAGLVIERDDKTGCTYIEVPGWDIEMYENYTRKA